MRLGLLSTAEINQQIIGGAAETDRVDVVAVGSRDGARAQAYAADNGIPRAHSSYEELLEDDEVDGIYRLFMRGDHLPTNIGNPVEYTVRQLAELVLELTGTKATIVQEPLPVDDPKVRRPDTTLAEQLLD